MRARVVAAAVALAYAALLPAPVRADPARVIDVPTRPGVTERAETHLPARLIGTSRGTQSVAFFATQVPHPSDGGADGIVLTSTILVGSNAQDRAVPRMPLENLAVPVLVVHHEHDGCRPCPFADVPRLTALLGAPPRSRMLAVDGGTNSGDPCEAQAYHGFKGIEANVVELMADWIATGDARR